MATGLDLITRSLRALKVLQSGEVPTDDEANDALASLNAMLDSWRNERLMVYAFQDESITMVNGQSSYTIGPSGDLVTTRPVNIEPECYMTESNIDYPVTVINKTRYDSIVDKTSTSDIVEYAYYEGTMPNGTLKVWPTPNTANVLHITTRVPLTSLTLAGTVSLPPGFEDAIVHNLAVHISPEYPSSSLSEITIGLAAQSKAGIKRVNSRKLQSGTELLELIGGGRHNILTDT